MNKAYLLVICLFLTSLTGCLDDDEDSYLEECEIVYEDERDFEFWGEASRVYACECDELVPYGDCSQDMYTEDYFKLYYDLSGQDLSGMNLTGIDLTRANLAELI